VGGAPSGQTQLAASQSAYYNTLTQEAQTEFATAQTLTNDLTSEFEPIFAAGPNQQGYSPEELANLNAAAVTETGQGIASVEKALGTKTAAEGGGNEFVPQGANRQLEAEVATSGENQTAAEESEILQAGYQQGYNEWTTAAAGLGEAASVMGAGTGAASAANQGGSAANQTYSNVAAENSSWMNLVGGALGAAGTALTNQNINL